MKKLILFIFLWFSFTIQASQINDCDAGISQLTCDSNQEVERLFDWAQIEYPDLFQDGYGTFVVQGYLARYYSKHNLYLGSKDREVYGLGDVLGGFVHFGSLDELLESTPKFSNIINTILSSHDEITVTTALGNTFIRSTGDEPTNIKVDNVVDTTGKSSIHIELSGGEAIIELPEISKQDITQKSHLIKRKGQSDYPLTETVDRYFAWFLTVKAPVERFSQARISGNIFEHTSEELNEGLFEVDAYIHEAARLLSICDKQWLDGLGSCEHQDKIPVLFIHGFLKEPNGPNLDNNRGEEYWGKFPAKLMEEGYFPFEFRWSTNAKFDDVASDLAKAIDTIYTATGKKKVHIVAHSFGGILLRTLLQVGPVKASEIINGIQVYTETPVKDMIATATTVGTPHSGIADKRKVMHDTEFPQGQDKDGIDWFELCKQLSCHLMGEDTIDAKYIADVFEISDDAGEWAKKLDETIEKLPGLNIQVLIGFSLHYIPGRDISFRATNILSTSFGDLLISGYGQRFQPELALDENSEHAWSPLLSEQKIGNARVSEFILGRSTVDDTRDSFIQSLYPEKKLGKYLTFGESGEDLKEDLYLMLYVPFKHSTGSAAGIHDYWYSWEVCIGCGNEGPNPPYHDTVQRVLDWMGKKLECNSDEILHHNVGGAAYCHTAIKDIRERANTDTRFISEIAGSYGENYDWLSDWELRWIDFKFLGDKMVRIYHATNKYNPSKKVTSFIDPDTDNWADNLKVLLAGTGNSVVDVPFVVGLSQLDAENAIVAADLTIGDINTELHPELPFGSVISQEPQEKTELQFGSAVSLVISAGPTEMIRVSIASNGDQATDLSLTPRISENGRYIAFESRADNLLPVDIEPVTYGDIFVHDRYTGDTSLVSVTSDGTRGSLARSSSSPDISADGRYVTFKSSDFLAPEDTYVYGGNIYLHDRDSGETSLVSITWNEPRRPSGYSETPKISADGRYVTFYSYSHNLVNNVTGGHIFAHELSTRTTKLVSVATDGTPGDKMSDDPSISADGRYIAFVSDATNLVPGEPLNKSYQSEVFLHDMVTGETSLVSVNSDGIRSDGDSRNPEISADGRYIVFESKSSTNIELGLERSYSSPNIYVHDRITKKTTLVSVHIGERGVSDESYHPQISADGRYITFESRARDLIPGIELPGGFNIFVRDQETGIISLVSTNPQGDPGSTTSETPHISADGHYITFESVANDLVPEDTNLKRDIFVRYLGQ